MLIKDGRGLGFDKNNSTSQKGLLITEADRKDGQDPMMTLPTLLLPLFLTTVSWLS